MAKVFYSRLPLIVAGSYAAIVLLLFVLALVIHDEFGFSFIPVLYATCPLSLFFEKHTRNLFIAIGAGGAANAAVLYALMKIVGLIKTSTGHVNKL